MRILSVWAVAFWCAGACALPADSQSPSDGPHVAVVRGGLLKTEADRAPLRAHLHETLSRAPEGQEIEQRSDGLRIVRRPRGFQHATLVTRDSSGARQQSCTDDARAAESALMQGAP